MPSPLRLPAVAATTGATRTSKTKHAFATRSRVEILMITWFPFSLIVSSIRAGVKRRLRRRWSITRRRQYRIFPRESAAREKKKSVLKRTQQHHLRTCRLESTIETITRKMHTMNIYVRRTLQLVYVPVCGKHCPPSARFLRRRKSRNKSGQRRLANSTSNIDFHHLSRRLHHHRRHRHLPLPPSAKGPVRDIHHHHHHHHFRYHCFHC